MPLGVIEVDGASRDRPDQAARDTLEDSILKIEPHSLASPANRREPHRRKGRHVSGSVDAPETKKEPKLLFSHAMGELPWTKILERETSLELATSTLARLRSTN